MNRIPRSSPYVAPTMAAVLLLALMGCGLSSTGLVRVTSGTPGTTAGLTTRNPAPPDRDATPSPTHGGAPTATPTAGHGSNPTATPTRQPPTPTPTATFTATPIPPTATPALPSVHEVSGTTTYYGGSIVLATATCPSGEVALGGGWNVPPATARVFAAFLSGNTWSVSAAPIGHTASTTVTAYAECLRDAPGATVTILSGPFSVPAGSFSGGGVGCGSSGRLVGWGISFGATSSLEMTSSLPELLAGWTIEFVNHGGTDVTGSVEAVCLSNFPTHASREQSGSVGVPTGMTGSNQVACTVGYPVAGGFQSGSGGGGNIYDLHVVAVGWADEAYALSNTISFNVWALCVYFG